MSKVLKNIISCVSGASILTVAAPVCLLSTSCSQDTILTEIPRNIDGHDWFGVSGGYFTDSDYIVDEDEHTVKYWNARNFVAENLIIPNYVLIGLEKYKVIIIDQCFSQCASLKGYVEFNDFQDEVPSDCFAQDVDLTALYMHQYPKKIGSGAFQDCLSFTNIFVHNQSNWTLEVEEIGMSAFEHTSLSGQLSFTNSIKEIGDNAFKDCTKLEEVNLDFSKITKVGTQTFDNCFKMHDIYLPATLTEIGIDAFKSCTSLRYVHIPNENMIINLGNEAFYNCDSFINFSKPCVLKQIGMNCFVNNQSLEINPGKLQGTELISEGAFSGCGFVTLTFSPEYSKMQVMSGAFADCLSLACIDFSAFHADDIPEWTGTELFNSTKKNGIIRVSEAMCKTTDPVVPTDNWLLFFEKFGLPLEGTGAWTFEIKNTH